MSPNTKIGALTRRARSEFALLGKLGVCAGLLLPLALGCAASDSTPGQKTQGVGTCGNGVLDPGEQCDGTVGANNCASVTNGAYPSGNLACASVCAFDISGCMSTTGSPPAAGGYSGGSSYGGSQSFGGTPPGVGGSTGFGGTPAVGGTAGVGAVAGAGAGGTLGSGGVVGSGGSIFPSNGGTPPASGGTGAGAGPGGMPAPQGAMDPVIPMISGDCPMWANGTISFMGLDGILVQVGTKASTASAPMLVYWHGTGSTSNEYQFMAAAPANGVIQQGGVIISFQNTTGGDLYSGTSIFGASDLTLVDQFVACAVRDYNVDPRKIWTMGCSAGGLFATAMAALRSSYVAAASPNSGGEVIPVTFDSMHTPPLMTVHGAMGSDVVVVDFSQTSATADTAFKGRGGFVIDCNTGGGHCGGAGLAPDAWTFLQAHTFGVSPEPWMSLPSGFSSQCTIQ